MPRKCVICGKMMKDDEEMIPYKNRYAHPSCFENAMRILKTERDEKDKKRIKEEKEKKKIRKTTPAAELKNTLSDEEYLEKREFYNLVRKLMGLDERTKLSPKVYALCDKYTREYEMTWKGMYQTLSYLKDIKEKELTGDIVGIIVYYYEEAQRYFDEIDKVEKNINRIDVNNLYKTRQIVFKKQEQKPEEDLIIQSLES